MDIVKISLSILRFKYWANLKEFVMNDINPNSNANFEDVCCETHEQQQVSSFYSFPIFFEALCIRIYQYELTLLVGHGFSKPMWMRGREFDPQLTEMSILCAMETKISCHCSVIL